jgi:MFS family permease
MRDEKKNITKISGWNWLIVVLLGLAGQIAWNVENSWFNTFVFDKITPDPRPIAWMSAVSAIIATITTLVMGTASDRLGKRKPFILYGYILWGISTIIFPTTAFFKVTIIAVIAVVVADAIMTFFGSTAYDSAFNAWTTDISDTTNRGTLSGVISILPLLAAIIGSALSGIIIDKFGYFTFFYTLGAAVSLMGIIGGIMLKDSSKLHKKPRNETQSFIKDMFSVFTIDSIKKNKEMFLVLTSLSLFSIGFLIYYPYLMIYLNNYLNISKSTAGIITAVSVLSAILIAVPAGKLADRGYMKKLAFAAPFIIFVGTILFSYSKEIYQILITASLQFIGYLVMIITLGAWIKNLMPEESRGQFEGVRMIFNVPIPMIFGPSIGSYLITKYGIYTVLNGEPGFVPTPVIFQAAAVLFIISIIPLTIINKKTGITTKEEGKEGVENGR